MPRPRQKRPPNPGSTDNGLIPVGTTATVGVLQAAPVVLTPLEEKFAQLFVTYNNATRAYVEASAFEGKRHVARVLAWEMSNKPQVRARVREYESAAAAAVVIDYAAILEHDRQIVEGFKYADEITQHRHICCRYCHGKDFRYQWVDFEEYLDALKRTDIENEKRREFKQREHPMPSDHGGYGFDPQVEPNLFCPRCEGRGTEVMSIADTTTLQGAARALVKGVRMTTSGVEVVFHDVDKAKERLLRAGGILNNDDTAKAAARGAAAGVVGAAAALKAAEKVATMTLDDAQRLYLELA